LDADHPSDGVLIPRRPTFGRLKDFRRVATRYDKLKRNFLAAVALAAIVLWWT
jgi:transposase